MDVEKMKLKILEAISGDLHKHIDRVFEELATKKKIEYRIEDVIDYYLKDTEKTLSLENSSRKSVEAKRDIAFIFYCLSCPFYYNHGIDETICKKKRKESLSVLKISLSKYTSYIVNAKHFYKFYADYRLMIDAAVQYIQKK